MTPRQIILWSSAYLIELVAVIYFTRATVRRVLGALVGGAAAALFGMGAIALSETIGWWRLPFAWPPLILVLLYLGLAISLTPIYLVIWRLSRRFGWRGPAVFIGIVAVIGPPRDYLIAALFPQWIVFAPGVAPILAVSAAYVGMVAVGHVMMRRVAGPARGDQLARRRPEAEITKPSSEEFEQHIGMWRHYNTLRQGKNTGFLSANSILVAIAGLLVKESKTSPLVELISAVALVVCVSWFLLLTRNSAYIDYHRKAAGAGKKLWTPADAGPIPSKWLDRIPSLAFSLLWIGILIFKRSGLI